MISKNILSLLLIIFILIFSNIVSAEQSEVDFSKIFENHGLVRLIIDAESGSIKYANKAAVDFYGYSKEELLNMEIQDINVLNPESVEEERKRAYSEEKNHFVFKHRLANGEIKTVEVHSYPVVEDGQKTLYSVIIDISSQVKLEKAFESNSRVTNYLIIIIFLILLLFLLILYYDKIKYKKLAIKDALTGAYSRLYLNEWVEDEINNNNDDDFHYSIVMIDIDKFKNINDKYGHTTGDKVLEKIVEVIESSIRKEDFVVRFGGDEFLVILHNCQRDIVNSIMERIKYKLRHNNVFDFPIDISYGIHETDNKIDFFNKIKVSDEKMYKYKKNNYQR